MNLLVDPLAFLLVNGAHPPAHWWVENLINLIMIIITHAQFFDLGSLLVVAITFAYKLNLTIRRYGSLPNSTFPPNLTSNSSLGSLPYTSYTAADWLFTSNPGVFGLIPGWALPTGLVLWIILSIMVASQWYQWRWPSLFRNMIIAINCTLYLNVSGAVQYALGSWVRKLWGFSSWPSL